MCNFMFALIVSSQLIWACSYRIFTITLNYHQISMLFLTCGLYQKASVSKVWIVAHCIVTLTLLSESIKYKNLYYYSVCYLIWHN